MIGWKVREIYRELEEGGGSWGRKQEKKEAHVERKAEGKSGDKLETAAVKAIQEAINRTPRRPKTWPEASVIMLEFRYWVQFYEVSIYILSGSHMNPQDWKNQTPLYP
ncbi:hypothetical protein Q9966_006812 [Columba livia]|nr:hypothetical protein Q9966_006812 [Columba livia]